MGDLPAGKSPISIARVMNSVGPAAVPPGVPAKSRSANHADRCRNNDRTGRNDDCAFVRVATTISATMFAAAATFRGLGTHADEARKRCECQNRKYFFVHLLGPFLGGRNLGPKLEFERSRPPQTVTSRALCSFLDEPGVNSCDVRHGLLPDSIFAAGDHSASQGNDAMRHRPECKRDARPGQRSLRQRDGSRSSRPPGTWIRCAAPGPRPSAGCRPSLPSRSSSAIDRP
jgi:hypothetical protein